MAPHLAPQAHEASRGRAALQSMKKQCGADTGTVTTTTGLLPPNKHLCLFYFLKEPKPSIHLYFTNFSPKISAYEKKKNLWARERVSVLEAFWFPL